MSHFPSYEKQSTGHGGSVRQDLQKEPFSVGVVGHTQYEKKKSTALILLFFDEVWSLKL